MLIDEIADTKEITLSYRSGEKEVFKIEKEENNMCYEIETFADLIEKNSVHHPYLYHSKMELTVMDEIRRQEHVIFPADGE